MSQDNYMPGYPSPDDFGEGNCPDCEGTGADAEDDTKPCVRCDGTGDIGYEPFEDDV